MGDSPFTEAEPKLQLTFRKQAIFPAVLMVLAVLLGRWLIAQTPDRVELGPTVATVRFKSVELDPEGFAPFRLAGAWAVAVGDPRFGGISALASDGNQLMALSDSGVVIRLPKPGGGHLAYLHELPDGPGDGRFKRNRDSEALLRDPTGGWWVAFENRHSLWRYNASFSQVLSRRPLAGRGWGDNKGVEGITASGDRLLLFPESGTNLLSISNDASPTKEPLIGSRDRVADASTLPQGPTILLLRQPTFRGFRNSLAWLEPMENGYRIARRISLGVGALDNMEGVAAERTASGTRLWLISDNNFHDAQRTLLLALDLREGFKRPRPAS